MDGNFIDRESGTASDVYEIKLSGEISQDWASLFSDMQISTDRSEGRKINTRLTGKIADAVCIINFISVTH